MTVTLLRGRKDRMYGVVPGGDDYYAFWTDGRAALYVDGSFVSYRSTSGPTLPGTPGDLSLIHTDSEELVGDGSLAYRVDVNNLAVWDVEGAATHDYAVPVGYVATPPIYADGWLWWVEREAVQHGSSGAYKTYFRLRQARADFSDVATVYTYELDQDGGYSVNWDPSTTPKLVLTAAGAITQCDWDDPEGGEVADFINVRLARNGSGATDSGFPDIGPGTVVDAWAVACGLPTALGPAFVAQGSVPATLADSATASPVDVWPGAWGLGGVANVSLDAAGAEAASFSGSEIVRSLAQLVSSGDPDSRFTVNGPPEDLGDVPHSFFIKG